tara:strand:- start:185 stop:12685 length:12501 start_codon:yes stop_codon:yes gene_type:complete
MNEELLQNIWQRLTDDGLTESDFQSWLNNVNSDEKIKQNVFSYLSEKKLTDSSYEDWNKNTGLKKKDLSQQQNQEEYYQSEPSIWDTSMQGITTEPTSDSSEDLSSSDQNLLDGAIKDREQSAIDSAPTSEPIDLSNITDDQKENILSQYYDKYGADYKTRKDKSTNLLKLKEEKEAFDNATLRRKLRKDNIFLYKGQFYHYEMEDGQFVRKDLVEDIDQIREDYGNTHRFGDKIQEAFDSLKDMVFNPSSVLGAQDEYIVGPDEEDPEVGGKSDNLSGNPISVQLPGGKIQTWDSVESAKRHSDDLESQIEDLEDESKETDEKAEKALTNFHTDLENKIRSTVIEKNGGMEMYEELSKKLGLNWGFVRTDQVQVKTGDGSYKNATFLEARNLLIKDKEFTQGVRDGVNEIKISDAFLKEDAGRDLKNLITVQSSYDGPFGQWLDDTMAGGLGLLAGQVDVAEGVGMTLTAEGGEYISKGGDYSNGLFEAQKSIQKRKFIYEYPGVINSALEGNILDAGEQLVGNVLGSVPQIMEMAVTNFVLKKIPAGKFVTKSLKKKFKAGKFKEKAFKEVVESRRKSFAKWTSAGLMGGAAFGQTKNELEELSVRNVEGGMSDLAIFFNAAAHGGFEVFFESKTLELMDGLKDLVKAIPASVIKEKGKKKVIEEVSKGAVKRFFRESHLEGLSEGFTEIGGLFTDIITNEFTAKGKGVNTPENLKSSLMQIGDAYLAGFGMFTGMKTVGVSATGLATGYNMIQASKINEGLIYTITNSDTGEKTEVDRIGLRSFLSNPDNQQAVINKSTTIDASMDPAAKELLDNLENGLSSKSGKKARAKLNSLNNNLDSLISNLESTDKRRLKSQNPKIKLGSRSDVEGGELESNLPDSIKNIYKAIDDIQSHIAENPFLAITDGSQSKLNRLNKVLKKKGIEAKEYTFPKDLQGIDFQVSENGRSYFYEGPFRRRKKNRGLFFKSKVDDSFNAKEYNFSDDVINFIKQSIKKINAQKNDPDFDLDSQDIYIPVGQDPSISVDGKEVNSGTIKFGKLTYAEALALSKESNNKVESKGSKQSDINTIGNNKILNSLDDTSLDEVTSEELNDVDGYHVLTVGSKNVDAETESNQLANLKKRLNRLGVKYKKVVSTQDGVRKESFIVNGLSKDQALQLTRDFNQEYTYSSKDGILYADGSVESAQKIRGSKSLMEGGVIAIKNAKGEVKYIGIRKSGKKSFGKEFNSSNMSELSDYSKDFPSGTQKIISSLVNLMNSVGNNIPIVMARNAKALEQLLIQDGVDLGKGVTAKDASNQEAFYNGGKMYVNVSNLTPQTMFHEVIHPLVRALKKSPEGRKVYSNIEKTVKDSKVKKRTALFDKGGRIIKYKSSSYYDWAKKTYTELGKKQGLKGEGLEAMILEEAFAEMMGDAAAQKFISNSSVLGQVRETIKMFLEAIFGVEKIKNILNRKNLDLINLGDVSDLDIRKQFKRAVVSGEKITIGGKDIDFGQTDSESKFSKSMDDSNKGRAERGDEVLTDTVEVSDEDVSNRGLTTFSLRERVGFKESDIPVGSIMDLNGQRVFVSPIDMSSAGKITSDNGISHNMMGGILYPMLNGTEGWAFTTKEKAQSTLDYLRKKGITKMVFMVQAPTGTLGNMNFIKYVEKELNNGLNKKKIGKRNTVNRLNDIVNLPGIVKHFNDKNIPLPTSKFKSVSDFMDYMESIGTGSRNIIMNKLIGETLLKQLGLPRKNEFLSFVNESIIGEARKGDVVGSIDIDVNSEVVETEVGSEGHHEGYPFAVKGSNFMVFNKFANILDVFPDYTSMSEVAKAEKENRVPKTLSTKTPAAAYSTMMYGAAADVNVNNDFTGGDLQYSRFSLSSDAKYNGIAPVGSKGFNEWFGKSKIVTPDGEPMMMFHGTPFVFDSFKDNSKGTFFTMSPEFANEFSGKQFNEQALNGRDAQSNIIPVYIKAENPFDFENPDHVEMLVDNYKDHLISQGFDVSSIETQDNLDDLRSKASSGSYQVLEKQFSHSIMEMGFDSFFVMEEVLSGEYKNIAVFNASDQIKSVYNNNYSEQELNSEGATKFSLKPSNQIKFTSNAQEAANKLLRKLGNSAYSDDPKDFKTPKKWLEMMSKEGVAGFGSNVEGADLLNQIEDLWNLRKTNPIILMDLQATGNDTPANILYKDGIPFTLVYDVIQANEPEVSVTTLYGTTKFDRYKAVLDGFDLEIIDDIYIVTAPDGSTYSGPIDPNDAVDPLLFTHKLKYVNKAIEDGYGNVIMQSNEWMQAYASLSNVSIIQDITDLFMFYFPSSVNENYGMQGVPLSGNYREVVLRYTNPMNTRNIPNSHYQEYKPILGWARIDERIGDNGEKIMFVREIQSDWQQRLNRREQEEYDERLENWRKKNKISRSADVSNFVGPKTVKPSKRGKNTVSTMLSDQQISQVKDNLEKLRAELIEKKQSFLGLSTRIDINSEKLAEFKEIKSIQDKIKSEENKILTLAGKLDKYTHFPWGQMSKSVGLNVRVLMDMAAREGFDYISFPGGELAGKIQGWGSGREGGKKAYEVEVPKVAQAQLDRLGIQPRKINAIKEDLNEANNNGEVLATNVTVRLKPPMSPKIKIKSGTPLNAETIKMILADPKISNVSVKPGLKVLSVKNMKGGKLIPPSIIAEDMVFDDYFANIFKEYTTKDDLLKNLKETRDSIQKRENKHIKKTEDAIQHGLEFFKNIPRNRTQGNMYIFTKDLVEDILIEDYVFDKDLDGNRMIEPVFDKVIEEVVDLFFADFDNDPMVSSTYGDTNLTPISIGQGVELELGRFFPDIDSVPLVFKMLEKAYSKGYTSAVEIKNHIKEYGELPRQNDIESELSDDGTITDIYDRSLMERLEADSFVAGYTKVYKFNKLSSLKEQSWYPRTSSKLSNAIDFLKNNDLEIESNSLELKSLPIKQYAENINKNSGVTKFRLNNDGKVNLDPNQLRALDSSYKGIDDKFPYANMIDGVATMYNFTDDDIGIINPAVEDLTEYGKSQLSSWGRPRVFFNLNAEDNSNLDDSKNRNKSLFPVDRLYPMDNDPLDIGAMADHNIQKFKDEGTRTVATLRFDTKNMNLINTSLAKVKMAIGDSDNSDYTNNSGVQETDLGYSFTFNYQEGNQEIDNIIKENCDDATFESKPTESIRFNRTEEMAKIAESAGFQGFLYEEGGEQMATVWSPSQVNPETRFNLESHSEKTVYVSDAFGFLLDIKNSVIQADYNAGRFLTGLKYYGSRVKQGQDSKGNTKAEIDPNSKLYDSSRKYDIRASRLIFKPFGYHTRKDIKDLAVYANGSLNLALYEANQNAKDLKRIVKNISDKIKNTKEYKDADANGKQRLLSNEIGHDKLQLLLTSKEARKVEENKELLHIINIMVNHVSELGQILINEGFVDGPLAAAIDANRGVYLHRKYKLYGKNSYSPTESVVEKARLFIMKELQGKKANEGKSEDELYDTAKKKVDLILKRDSGSLDFLSKGFGNAITADTSVFKSKNENLPKEIRDLMGEVTDPFNNYLTTIGKIAKTVASDRMYDQLLDIGLGDFISAPMSDNKTLPEGDSGRFSGNQLKGRKWGALEGYFVDNEMYGVLTEYDESMLAAQANGGLRSYLNLIMLGKKFKTIYSIGTHGRNVIGNTSFMAMNGHAITSKKDFENARNSILQVIGKGDKEMDALYKKLVSLGVVNTNAFLQEIKSISNQLDEAGFEFNDYFSNRDDKNPKAFDGIKDGLGKLDKFLTKAYQAEDDVFKIFGWMQEKNRYIKAGFPESLAERQAARNIRNTYPNYDEVPAFVRTIGRFPLVGTFVAFQAETWRCAKNSLVIAKEEMESSNPELKKLGIKRMACCLASLTLTETLQVMLAQLGYSAVNALFADDEDEERDLTMRDRDAFSMPKHVERILPSWDRNGNNFVHSQGTMIDMDPRSTFYRQEVPYIDYINLSKMSGTGFIRDTFRVLYKGIRDPKGAESFARLVKQVYEPFLSVDMTTDGVLEVLQNENNRIYRESDNFIVQFVKGMSYIGDKVGPSTAISLAKIAEISAVEESNKSVESETMALFGFRKSKLMPYTAARYDYSSVYKGLKDIAKGEENILDKITTPFTDRPKFSLSDESATKSRYKDMESPFYDSGFDEYINDMVSITMGLRGSGGRGSDIIKILTGPGIKMPKWLAMDILVSADYEIANN